MAEETGLPRAEAQPAGAVPSSPAASPGSAPVPLEVPLESQIAELPSLAYPGGDNREFQEWAEQRRRRRLRLEVAGGVLLLLAGGAAYAITRRGAFAVIAIFAVLALAAYEFLVDSFE
jgi:hypothetical protein